MRDYSASTTNGGEIRVEFTNDSGDRDVQVDYITVIGETRQAEDQADNTGAYDGSCGGGSYSKMLHCNGSIGFGTVAGGSSSSSSSSSSGGKMFVGNITTNGSIRSDFGRYWDQITLENGGKWGSVVGSRDQYNWSKTDDA